MSENYSRSCLHSLSSLLPIATLIERSDHPSHQECCSGGEYGPEGAKGAQGGPGRQGELGGGGGGGAERAREDQGGPGGPGRAREDRGGAREDRGGGQGGPGRTREGLSLPVLTRSTLDCPPKDEVWLPLQVCPFSASCHLDGRTVSLVLT